MTYLPRLYEHSRVMAALLDAVGGELDLLRAALDQVLDQAFIPTATWGLAWWEEQFGLSPGITLPLDERRARVLSKRRGATARLLPILEAMAPGLQGRWAGGRIVLVLPQWADYDWGFMIPVLEQRKPAHLGYGFSVDPGDGGSGYLALAEHRTRHRVYLVPMTGTLRSGRWPTWSVPGSLQSSTPRVVGERRAGVAAWPAAGTGQAGLWPTPAVVGAMETAAVTAFTERLAGVAEWAWAGPSAGAVAARTVSAAGARHAAPVTYQRCGTFRLGEVA